MKALARVLCWVMVGVCVLVCIAGWASDLVILIYGIKHDWGFWKLLGWLILGSVGAVIIQFTGAMLAALFAGWASDLKPSLPPPPASEVEHKPTPAGPSELERFAEERFAALRRGGDK
jgi:hypothetical protein